eukprot:CAMPEP_0170553988 /NCGR_PEP_ID=MMETSP0211-20121228/11839_1 /TAXON_ID=311385 /ORGANISM="Pseudokeronopsis sp., Strain OXSARD2" /LENGTH=59 /DNA_ID=CAMNT_0010862719 /DNA_START=25 /DNA_END=203 /DNA_ORIENTATION=+
MTLPPSAMGSFQALVSVTAPCNNIEPYSAVAIGTTSGLVYILACVIWKKLKIDDPLEAS